MGFLFRKSPNLTGMHVDTVARPIIIEMHTTNIIRGIYVYGNSLVACDW